MRRAWRRRSAGTRSSVPDVSENLGAGADTELIEQHQDSALDLVPDGSDGFDVLPGRWRLASRCGISRRPGLRRAARRDRNSRTGERDRPLRPGARAPCWRVRPGRSGLRHARVTRHGCRASEYRGRPGLLLLRSLRCGVRRRAGPLRHRCPVGGVADHGRSVADSRRTDPTPAPSPARGAFRPGG